MLPSSNATTSKKQKKKSKVKDKDIDDPFADIDKRTRGGIASKPIKLGNGTILRQTVLSFTSSNPTASEGQENGVKVFDKVPTIPVLVDDSSGVSKIGRKHDLDDSESDLVGLNLTSKAPKKKKRRTKSDKKNKYDENDDGQSEFTNFYVSQKSKTLSVNLSVDSKNKQKRDPDCSDSDFETTEPAKRKSETSKKKMKKRKSSKNNSNKEIIKCDADREGHIRLKSFNGSSQMTSLINQTNHQTQVPETLKIVTGLNPVSYQLAARNTPFTREELGEETDVKDFNGDSGIGKDIHELTRLDNEKYPVLSFTSSYSKPVPILRILGEQQNESKIFNIDSTFEKNLNVPSVDAKNLQIKDKSEWEFDDFGVDAPIKCGSKLTEPEKRKNSEPTSNGKKIKLDVSDGGINTFVPSTSRYASTADFNFRKRKSMNYNENNGDEPLFDSSEQYGSDLEWDFAEDSDGESENESNENSVGLNTIFADKNFNYTSKNNQSSTTSSNKAETGEIISLEIGKYESPPVINPFTCPIANCGKTFSRNNGMNKHVRVVHKYTSKCQECKIWFPSPEDLLKHEQAVHNTEITKIHPVIKSFTCPIANCGKTYTLRNNMNSHLRVVHKYEAKCRECRILFPSQEDLLKHQQEVHSTPTEINVYEKVGTIEKSVLLKQIRCTYPSCFQWFTNIDLKNAHLKKFHRLPVYKCGVCRQAFFSETDRQVHGKIHGPKYENGALPHYHFNMLQSNVTKDRNSDKINVGEKTVPNDDEQINKKNLYEVENNVKTSIEHEVQFEPFKCAHCYYSFKTKKCFLSHQASFNQCLKCKKECGCIYAFFLHTENNCAESSRTITLNYVIKSASNIGVEREHIAITLFKEKFKICNLLYTSTQMIPFDNGKEITKGTGDGKFVKYRNGQKKYRPDFKAIIEGKIWVGEIKTTVKHINMSAKDAALKIFRRSLQLQKNGDYVILKNNVHFEQLLIELYAEDSTFGVFLILYTDGSDGKGDIFVAKLTRTEELEAKYNNLF